MTEGAKYIIPLHKPDRFEEFWNVFPLKKGKALAKAKWDLITGPGLKTRTLDRDSGTYMTIFLEASPEEIIEGAWRYRAEQIDGSKCALNSDKLVLKDDGRYTKHASNWLNRGCWEDE